MDSMYLQHTPEAAAEQGELEVKLLRTERAQTRGLEEDGEQCLRLGEGGSSLSWEDFSPAHASLPGKPKGN